MPPHLKTDNLRVRARLMYKQRMESMPLVLSFRGSLPPVKRDEKRKEEKQNIRRVLHEQLNRVPKKPYNTLFRDCDLYRVHVIGGFKFHPLICKHKFYPRRGCELQIEILSNDPFGAIYSNGDLDNRLKTLFDALCLPRKEQLPLDQLEDGEGPFWVLLSDDQLITDLRITQHILHEPMPGPSWVDLKLKVKIKDAYGV